MSSSSNSRTFVCSIFLTNDTILFHRFYTVCSTTFSGFLIFSFISLYYRSTLFSETNSEWVIYESIGALEIKTSIIFDLVLADNSILSCFFFFFLIIYLHFLIPAVTVHIFIPTAEPKIPTGTPTNEANKKLKDNHW